MGLYDRDYMRHDWNSANKMNSHCEAKYCPKYATSLAQSDEELSHGLQFRNRLALRINSIIALLKKKLVGS